MVTKLEMFESTGTHILDAAACINKLRQNTHDIHTQVTKCIEVDGGILKHLLRTVTNL
jgi:pentose-5-phosphate-3-epimerase